MAGWTSHDRVVPYVISVGLYYVSRLGSIAIDHSSVVALVERWREETHTFHLPVDKATITLQDVAVQLGLPIDGRAVVSPVMYDIHAVVRNY